MTKLSTVIFSMSSANIRNANSVFNGVSEKTKEQKKLSSIAKRVPEFVRDSRKPGPVIVVNQK